MGSTAVVPNQSSKRTASPPLNSSVSRQSSFLLLSVAFLGFWLRFGKAHRVVSGWPALLSFVRLVVWGFLRALVPFAFSCFVVRAVCRNVASVASGSFFARRPQPSRRYRTSKAVLSFLSAAAQLCCRLTSHSSGRLRRRLIPALDVRERSHERRERRASTRISQPPLR
jgi:hypothetical protein